MQLRIPILGIPMFSRIGRFFCLSLFVLFYFYRFIYCFCILLFSPLFLLGSLMIFQWGVHGEAEGWEAHLYIDWLPREDGDDSTRAKYHMNEFS